MPIFRKLPATLILIAANLACFTAVYLKVRTFSDPIWTFNLLTAGAEFNAYTLGGEWYRLFTSMFLHGNLPHLLLNMYALYFVGSEIEKEAGTGKFLAIYFVTGIAAGLNSLYWSLFTIGVGASGAIFGLFGFSFVYAIVKTRKTGAPITGIVINFTLFLIINLIFSKSFHGDNAAHLGGLACGLIIGIYTMLFSDTVRATALETFLIPTLLIIFFMLPRYQVTYFRFFQQVLSTDDFLNNLFGKADLKDEDYLKAFRQNNAQWDSTLHMLDSHTYLPPALHSDTFKLKQYIKLRKKENLYRITMIERESYIYLDSVDIVRETMKGFRSLDYPLVYRKPMDEPPPPAIPKGYEQAQVWYDKEWTELPGPPGSYYRLGTKDSLGRWQGPVRDFFANGHIQMKGSYKNDRRDGIFIYYSDHDTHLSAGRYADDKNVGKWENFYGNEKLQSEIYFKDRYFLKNLWDSTGVHLVKDGEGIETQRYDNGIISMEGKYHDGYREGYWYGRYKDGSLYFEENYRQGQLVNGRSVSPKGEIFFYDESSLYPIPTGGFPKLIQYLEAEATKTMSAAHGAVRVSFRVAINSQLSEFHFESSLSKELDEKARQILTHGPRWMPAKVHGQKPVTGYGFAVLNF